MDKIIPLLKKKLSEGSTWNALAIFVGGLGFAHSDEIGKLMPTIGVVVMTLLGIYFP
jgi:hypothetical protein